LIKWNNSYHEYRHNTLPTKNLDSAQFLFLTDSAAVRHFGPRPYTARASPGISETVILFGSRLLVGLCWLAIDFGSYRLSQWLLVHSPVHPVHPKKIQVDIGGQRRRHPRKARLGNAGFGFVAFAPALWIGGGVSDGLACCLCTRSRAYAGETLGPTATPGRRAALAAFEPSHLASVFPPSAGSAQ